MLKLDWPLSATLTFPIVETVGKGFNNRDTIKIITPGVVKALNATPVNVYQHIDSFLQLLKNDVFSDWIDHHN